MSDYNWKPVDDRYPEDREIVTCKCGDGGMFLGFCIRPYSDCGSIKTGMHTLPLLTGIVSIVR